MKILITVPDCGLAHTDFLRAGNIVYAPDLAHAPAGQLAEALLRHEANALITVQRPPVPQLQKWLAGIPGPKFLSYVIGVPDWPGSAELAEVKREGNSLDAIAVTLQRWEREHTFGMLLPDVATSPSTDSREAVLAGAGIVNLVTALYLSENGYRVTVLDQSVAAGTADWQEYGCTHAGDDARMFTFTEMDNYNNQDFGGSAPGWMRVPVTGRGWLARRGRGFSAAEQAWIEEFESVPSWLARAYNDDVFAFAVEAGHEWAALRADYPELFSGVMLTDSILRLYSDPGQLAGSLARHQRIGALGRELTPAELAAEFPAFAGPLREKFLAGGFLVPGFTVNIHQFAKQLIAFLAGRGVRFHWRTPVTRVRRDGSGQVSGFGCGFPLPAGSHLVASPGVGGQALLDGSPCAGKIHGVLGGWMRISNANTRLGLSLKVARRGHVTEDANVTVARDADGREILIVGSGYGYLGDCTGGAPAPDAAELAAVRQGILDTVEGLFLGCGPLPASSHRGDNYGFKYCVRPWTATSLGLYHAETSAHGGLYIITGGHNTGGFAQSPAIARAVLASLRGEVHPMHALYHPNRLAAFRGDPTPAEQLGSPALLRGPAPAGTPVTADRRKDR